MSIPRRRVPADRARTVVVGACRGSDPRRHAGGMDGAPNRLGRPGSAGAVEQPDVDPAGAASRGTVGRHGYAVGRRGAGDRGGQPRGLRSAAARGQRRQLQRLLAGRRHRADAHLADHRSAGRQDSPAVGRGGGADRRRARRAQPARPVHLARHLQRPEPVDPLHLARVERHRELVQQQLPDLPGAGLRRRLPGADPRATDHPAGRTPTPAGVGAPMAGRLARTLGGGHARRRDHQLHPEDELPRVARHPAPDGVVYAPRRRHARLPVHHQRPADVSETVDGGAADEPDHDRVSIFEYACHEGNYAMEGILAGARAEER